MNRQSSKYKIAEIGFGSSTWNFKTSFEYKGINFEVQRFGADYSVENAKKLIEKLRGEVDAFAMTSLPPSLTLDRQSFVHRQYFEIMNTPSSVPLCDGTGLRELSNLTSLKSLLRTGDIEVDSRFFFPAALTAVELEEYIRHCSGAEVAFGDLHSGFNIPFLMRPFLGLKTLTKAGLFFAANRKIEKMQTSRAVGRITKQIFDLQNLDFRYVVADLPVLTYYKQSLPLFSNSELIVWSLHAGMEKNLEQQNFKKTHNLFPKHYRMSPYMNYALLEATLRLAHRKDSSLSFEEWGEFLKTDVGTAVDVRRHATARKNSSQVKVSSALTTIRQRIFQEKKPDFAFVVHALSHRDFEKAPGVGKLIAAMPKSWNDRFDRTVSKLPPVMYGKIRNVVSEFDGREVNGLVYALWATPKVLRNQDPDITYAQIQRCAYDAAAKGAKIIGLGAYTKVVGDSGVTINKNSPLPVTTGNSLSASATLWGLNEVVRKMQLVDFDSQGRVIGTAMIIGATGSIGKVSAKLLALAFNKIIIVAPRIERLNELKQELKILAPHCQVICSVDANEWAPSVDAIVTATSAFDQKIIDVLRIKPGCVVCDCSRPLDFEKSDAIQRPDVIIVESGELLLPGPAKVDLDLGLPGDTVYACLAETCVLAMEQKYESFTLGRDIEWNKVKEIYKMSIKHGVKLAGMQGHMGLLTDREIALTRELALTRLKKWK